MSSSAEVQARFYEAHPGYDKAWKLSKSIKRHGLTKEEYNALVVKGCAICGANPERLRFDHDHQTDEFRGLLCNECNVGLGMFNDDVERMIDATTYLNAAKWKH